MLKNWEREFLIRLAPVWLACRWKIMGNTLHAWPHGSDLAYDILGCYDYSEEMKLLCEEWRTNERINRTTESRADRT